MLHPQLICTLEVNRLLQEGEAQRSTGPLGEDRVLAALNRAYQSITQFGQQHEHPDLIDYVNTSVYNTTTGLMDQPIPMRATSVLALAERINDYPTREERNAVLVYRRNGSASGYKFMTKYEVLGRQIYARMPFPSQNYRLWYMKEMPLISYGLVHADQTVSSQNVLSMRTTPTHGSFDYRSNIYVGQMVYIYAGDSVGSMGKITSVTRVDANHYQATCVSLDSITSPNTPFANGGLGVNSYYCILPWIPPSFYPYLAMETAKQFTMHDGAQLLIPTLAENKAKFEEYISPYDPSSARGIIPNFGSDLGLDESGAIY